MTIEQLYTLYQQYPSVQTDTRQLQKDDLFFALKGPNFNGNLFATAALDAGAAYAIVDEAPATPHDRIIVVDDALKTLQALALHHRQQFNIPFIAITGSNGKTTTKELIHAVLSSAYITYTTKGNLNNHIGIPLTLLRIGKDAQMAVVEMGANHIGEIRDYCRYTLPTHGIITNCGKAHLEGFGSEEGVRRGKGELYDHLRAHAGTAFIMWDYPYLQEMSHDIHHRITYGTTGDVDIAGHVLESTPFLSVKLEKGTTVPAVQTQLVGDYNLPNILAAIAVARHFKVPEEQWSTAIRNYTPSNSRSQLIEQDSNHIILDAYNANPSSMALAITNFAKVKAPGKVLMLGAMAELGTDSLQEHETILQQIQQYDWKAVVLVGGDFLKLSHPFISFANSAEAAAWFQQQQFTDTWVLIKGSRSMKMEQVISAKL